MPGDKSTDKSANDARDKDLRARFAELRSEEAADAPEFALPGSGKVHPRPRRWGYIRVTAAACVVAVAFVIGLRLIPRKPERNTTSVASLTEWKAPTDFLLETPGRELLETVPVIGAWPDSSTISDPGRKDQQGKLANSQVRKRVLP
jgi:hypothetical protein